MGYFTEASTTRLREKGWNLVHQFLPNSNIHQANISTSVQIHEYASYTAASQEFLYFLWSNRAIGGANEKPNPLDVDVTRNPINWTNSRAVRVNQRFTDPDLGTFWRCLIAHTTAGAGTFATDRTANPTYWEEVLTDYEYECRIEYTSLTKARAATTCRAMHACNYTSTERNAVATAAGFSVGDLKTQANIETNKNTYFVNFPTDPTYDGDYMVVQDYIEIPGGRLTNWQAAQRLGIMLDHEVSDGQSEADTATFVADIAGKVQAKGYEFWFYTNGVTSSAAANNGIGTTSAPLIADDVDYFCPVWDDVVTSGTVLEDIQAQVDIIINGNAALLPKIRFAVEIGVDGTSPTLHQCRELYRYAKQAGMTGFVFWRNGWNPATSTLDFGNRKKAILGGDDQPILP